MTDATRQALETARTLAECGIPLFLAAPDPSTSTGYLPPRDWQSTEPDPLVVDAWNPGLALCAVTGRGLDVIDVDPRNGGKLEDIQPYAPCVYAVADTPSGGIHAFIKSLGVPKSTNLMPGIDIQAGAPDGSGRGFVFLAPTVRKSKVDGESRSYRWKDDPFVGWPNTLPNTGDALAALVRESKGGSSVGKRGGPDWWSGFLLSTEPQPAQSADRAINDKLDEVRSWNAQSGIGFRAVVLRAAMTLGGYVGGGYIEEDQAREWLRDAISGVWGRPDTDDELWITQGVEDGQALPFKVYTPADVLARGQVSSFGQKPWTIYDAIGLHAFDPHGASDQDLAEEVIARMQPALRYLPDSSGWLLRQRDLWLEREDAAGWAVSTVARLMPLGDEDYPKNKADYTMENWRAKARARFMSSSQSAPIERKIKTVLKMEGHSGSVRLADLDSEPEVLWAGGLPWDLRASGAGPVLADLDPAMPHLHSALIAPESVATPTWDHFLAQMWPDPAVRAWGMRVLSLSLAGYPDAALPVLYGSERTGKTALVTLLMEVLGSYGHSADPRLLSGGDNVHASVVYALKGRRLSFIDEGPRRGLLAAERLKQLTGGGMLTGNAMRSNPITFKPTHTLIMTTNDAPMITDPALKARMRVIPCEGDQAAVKIARRSITPDVWAAESPGVLAQLMSECAAWLADQDSALSSAAPDWVIGETDELSGDQDTVGEWVEMNTVPSDPGTAAGELYEAYCRWYVNQSRHGKSSPVTQTAFGRRLNDLGYPGVKQQGPRKNQTYRPLSVVGGSIITAPWEPRSASGYTQSPIVAGSTDFEPTATDKPSSSTSFSLFSDSSVSSHNTNKLEKTTTQYTENYGNTEKISTDCKSELKRAPDQGELGLHPVSGKRSEGPLSAQRAEIAAYAHENKLTKAAARAELKELARLEAIAEAQGEFIGLPAVVDREGHVLKCTKVQAGAIIDTCLKRTGGALTVDVETSGYPIGHKHHRLRSVQLGDEVASVVLDPVEDPSLIINSLNAAVSLHAHSATADISPLAYAGLCDFESAWDRMYDTVIPAKLGDPQSTGSDPALKKLAVAVLGDASVSSAADAGREAVFKAGKWLTKAQNDTPVERNGWAQIDTGCETMLRYAASDVLDTAALAKRLPPVPPAVYERERVAEQLTARVAYHGLALDKARIDELTTHHTAEQTKHGGHVKAFGIENPGSAQQIAKALRGLGAELPCTEKGSPSVAEHVLTSLRRSEGQVGVLAGHVLDYRKSTTALGLFLEPYRLLCDEGDGRARPTIYTLGTDTGRMSSVRPNFQQLPREGGVRSVVVADPGMTLISADFSGVELRGAAALSQDPTMMHMIREEDEGRFDGFHWAVARQAFGPDATKAHRYIAKRGVFGHIYGGGVATLAKQVGVPEHEMGAIVESLKSLTPGLAQWSDAIRQAVREGRTQFPAYSGRIIHFPPAFPHKAPNYAIQGSCRELLVDALIRWRDTKWGECIVLPIHDELIVMVPEEDAEAATTELVRCMESELYGVKIVADPGKRPYGSRYWKDAT